VDGTSERGFSRPLKAALVAVAIAALLAVVALAARGGHPGGRGRLHQREVPAWVGNDLLTILVVAYTLAAIALVVAFILARDEWKPPTGRTWLRHLLTFGVLLAALALLGYRSIHHVPPGHGRRSQVQEQQTGPGGRRARTLPKLPAAKRPAQFDWVLAAAIGGGLLLLAVLVLARRRGELEIEDGETVEEDLSAVVADTIDDLRREADPRRAVIAAYARMERVLAQHGQPRHPSEAPFEYLARILLRLRVRAAAVRDLTELFERAKFSSHEIDQPMKERAISALVSVRDDLQAATA
jgi:Domain of unknown function (DUF4129)